MISNFYFLPQLPTDLDLTVEAQGTGQGILEVPQHFLHLNLKQLRVIFTFFGHFLVTCALTPGGDALQPAA